jgi:flagellar hook-associated protein FlgK
MMRRIILATFLLLSLTPSAWPKFKEDEQKYLDDQFKAVLDQMQALGNQIAALNAQLAALKQNQDQLQAVMNQQKRQLQDVDELLSSQRIGNEDNFAKLKTAIADLRAQTDNAVSKLTGQPAEPTGAPPEVTLVPRPPAPASRQTNQGYITNVDGTNVMIDKGSAQGMQVGSQLAVYKATDPNTRVGVIEITQVVDSGNSRAHIVTMNAGVKPEFGDIIRVQ